MKTTKEQRAKWRPQSLQYLDEIDFDEYDLCKLLDDVDELLEALDKVHEWLGLEVYHPEKCYRGHDKCVCGSSALFAFVGVMLREER